MKIILAYNPFGDIKAKALNRFLKRSDITSTNMASLASGTKDEKTAFEKATKFFDKNNFRRHFEELVPNDCPFVKYDFIYSGALLDLAKNDNSFDEFFGAKFSLGKVDENGNYSDFKTDCRATHLAGWLNDAFGILRKKAFRNAIDRDEQLKKELNGIIEKFKNGAIGISKFYENVNSLADKMGDAGSSKELSVSEAWEELRKNKVMHRGEYDCYCVKSWYVLNPVAHTTSWCVSHDGNSGRNYFDGGSGYIYPNYDEAGNPTKYINDKKNAYYMICKGTNPVALFNVSVRQRMYQFKGVDDNAFVFDRPSAKDVIEIGDELRKMLGVENVYEDDFAYVFEDFDAEAPDAVIGINWEEVDTWKNDDEAVEYFIKELEKFNDKMIEVLRLKPWILKDHRIHDAVSKINFIDEIDDTYFLGNIGGYFIDDEPMRTMFCHLIESRAYNQYQVFELFKDRPEILEYQDVRKALIKGLKHYVENWHVLIEKCPFVFKYDDISNAFYSMDLLGQNNLDTLCKNDMLMQNPKTQKLVVHLLEKFPDSYNFKDALTNPALQGNEEILSQVKNNLEKGLCVDIVEEIPELLDYAEIVTAFAHCIEKSNSEALHAIGVHHDMLDNRVLCDALTKCIKEYGTSQQGKNITVFNFLRYNSSLLKRKEIHDALADCMRQGYGLDFIELCPDMLNDKDIHDRFVNTLESGSSLYIVKENPSLLNDKDICSRMTNWWVSYGDERVLEALYKNPSVLEDKNVYEAVIEGIKENGNMCALITKASSLLDNKEVYDKFIETMHYENNLMVIKRNISLLDNSDIRNRFGKLLDNATFGFDHDHMPDNDCIWGIVEDNPSLLKYNDIRIIFIDALKAKEEHTLSIIYKNEYLLNDSAIMDALIDLAHRGAFNELMLHPDLFKNQKIRKELIAELRRGRHNLTVNSKIVRDYDDVAEAVVDVQFEDHQNFSSACSPSCFDNRIILDGFLNCFKKDSRLCMSWIKNHTGLLDNPEVLDAFLKAEQNNDSEDTFYEVCHNSSNIKVIDACLQYSLKHYDNMWIAWGVLKNFNEKLDEKEMYEMCKKIAKQSWDCKEEFFARFRKIANSTDFWDFFLTFDSNSIFKLLKEYHMYFPNDILIKLSKMDDGDLRWLVNRILKQKQNEKTAKIAKKIMLADEISWRIAVDLM